MHPRHFYQHSWFTGICTLQIQQMMLAGPWKESPKRSIFSKAPSTKAETALNTFRHVSKPCFSNQFGFVYTPKSNDSSDIDVYRTLQQQEKKITVLCYLARLSQLRNRVNGCFSEKHFQVVRSEWAADLDEQWLRIACVLLECQSWPGPCIGPGKSCARWTSPNLQTCARAPAMTRNNCVRPIACEKFLNENEK